MSRNIIEATLQFVDRFTTPLDQATANFTKRARQIQKTGKDIYRTGQSISKAGMSITKGITVPIVGMGAAAFKAGMDFESGFAGVKKTIDATPKQLEKIKTGIRDMAKEIPMTTEEISKIAETAGQLGIKTDQILSFTRTMADLGVATNLTGEEAASALAKFANVTNMDQSNFDKLGAVIVDLGNHFATTESDIVAMATRLAGAGSQIGLSQGEIMGFATALSSVGIEAEMGGSAFSKAMIKMKVATATGLTQVQDLSKKTGMSLRDMQLMSDNDSKGFRELAQSLGMTKTEMNNVVKSGVELEHFSKIAGMTTGQFKKLFEANPGKAMDAFIKGLGDTKNQGKSTIEMLQDMGFTEVRLRDSLTRMANGNALVSEAMEMGNDAWKEGTALTKEANQRYETTISKLSTLGNCIKDVGIDVFNIMSPAFNKIISKITEVAKKFPDIDESTKKTIIKFSLFAASIGPAILILGKLTSIVGLVVFNFGKFFYALKKAKSFLALINTPSTIVVLSLIAISTATYLVIKNWDKLKRTFEENEKTIKTVATVLGVTFAPALAKTAVGAVVSLTKALLVNGLQILLTAAQYTVAGVVSLGKYIASGWKTIAMLAKMSATFVINTATLIAHKVAVLAVNTALKLWAIGTKAVSIAQFALNAAFVSTPIGWIVLGIAAVIAIGVLLIKNWDKVKEGAGKLWGGIKKIFAPIGKWFGNIWEGVKSGFKAFINFLIGGLNLIPEGLNKLSIDVPEWVPKIGGKNLGFHLPTIPLLYKGTNNWAGGPAMIHDRGAEIVDLPSGSRVYPHDKSIQMARNEGKKNSSIRIAKLADQIVIREDADIDRIVDKLARKLIEIQNNSGGGNEILA